MTKQPGKISRFFFSIFTGLLRGFALLPLGAMYVLSDVLAFLLYHVFRYRRKVVRANLTACFPDKSLSEIRKIERAFYRGFTDYIFETIKLLHISDKQMTRRMTFSNVEIMDRFIAEGKDIVVYFSHNGNWEWATSVRLHSRYADDANVVFGQIYRPLRNGNFDRLMLCIRDRFKTRCIPKKTTLRELIGFRKENRRFVVGFMSDQKPGHNDPVRIVDLFGRPTAVITGTETLARRLGTAVVYWDISRPRRGHYHIDVVEMTENASDYAEGSLTSEYFRMLERTVSRQPELWLWSHKRWKNSPRSWEDVEPQTILTNECAKR